MTTPITRALLRKHGACYSNEQLDSFGLPDGTDLLTILRHYDIPAKDRVWLATRPGVVKPTVLWRWLALLVERALDRVDNPDPRSLAVIPLLRRLGAGENVPKEERRAAIDGAHATAQAAARLDAVAAWSAWSAYHAAAARGARSDVWASAWHARSGSWYASNDAGADAEGRQQVRDLIDLLADHNNVRCDSITREFREMGKGS